MTETPKPRFAIEIPADIRKEYLEQSDTLEYKAVTKNGEIKFGSWIARFSGFLQEMLRGDKKLSNSKTIHFNGEKGSVAEKDETVKIYFDTMHGVLPVEPDVIQSLELLKFLNADGKRIFEFEKGMFNYYMKRLATAEFSAKQKLLACVILKSFDLNDVSLEKNLVNSIPWETVTSLIWETSNSNFLESMETAKLGELITGKTKDDPDFEMVLEAELFKYVQTLKKYFELTIYSDKSILNGAYSYLKEINGEHSYAKLPHQPGQTIKVLMMSENRKEWKFVNMVPEAKKLVADKKHLARSTTRNLTSTSWETYNHASEQWESDFYLNITRTNKFPCKQEAKKKVEPKKRKRDDFGGLDMYF